MSVYNPTGKELLSHLEGIVRTCLKRGETMSDGLEKEQLDLIYDEFTAALDDYIAKAEKP
ncbi:hypothetical protein LCGC14_0892020 [marine sediment metagenome]|uniref:Uncharacterized protein n=1 Tax=marine sediment metagenome TaxID=412755 RepID=A0A0F9P3P2_9ZZZZ